MTLALGNGQGLIRLLQFSAILASENKEVSLFSHVYASPFLTNHLLHKLQLSFWNDLVKTYFTPKAVMKFTLWKDNQRLEAKPFGEWLLFACLCSLLPMCRHSRNRRTHSSAILPRNYSIWRKIHDFNYGWC